MNKARIQNPSGNPKNGQAMVVFAILLPFMLLYCALGIDVGMMYLTKAKLSRSVDATALRVVDRYEPDISRLRDLALTTMQANMPEFMTELPEEGWTTRIEDGDEIHELRNSSGEWLEILIRSDDENNVITTTTQAGVRHETYFMPLVDIDTIDFQALATAERFPACNVLILDLSGSMRGTKAENLVAGVKAFVKEFVDDRDFMAVVSFSTVAKVVFPDRPDDEGNFLPTQNFASGLSGDTSRSVPSIMDDKIRFSGATNAAEGMRVAFREVDKFLSQFDEDERDQIKVHYVFFTDGEFNTFRGFARGIGYGIEPGPDPTEPEIGATFHPGQLNPVNDLPDWHGEKPLISSEFFSSTPFQYNNGDPIIFTGFSGSTGTNYNLDSLVRQVEIIASDHSDTLVSPNNSSMPGVNAIIQGYRLQNAQWRDMLNQDELRDGNDGRNANFPDDWDYMVYATEPSGNRVPLTEEMVQEAIEDAGEDYHDEWKYMVGREWYKQRRDHNLFFPVAYDHSWDPTHSDRAQQEFSEYYPGGRMFANVRSRFPEDTNITGATSASTISTLHEHSIFFERKGSGLGPEDGITGNYDTWNYGTERLSDHYPYYTYGGDFDYPPVDHTWDGSYIQNKFNENNIDWNRIGPPWQFYSFMRGEWRDALDNSAGLITDEGDWTAEAQAFLARIQHDAKIFTIRLKGGNAAVGRRMANDQSNGEPFFDDQPQGKYYETTDPNELVPIFRDIAQRITTRLAE